MAEPGAVSLEIEKVATPISPAQLGVDKLLSDRLSRKSGKLALLSEDGEFPKRGRKIVCITLTSILLVSAGVGVLAVCQGWLEGGSSSSPAVLPLSQTYVMDDSSALTDVLVSFEERYNAAVHPAPLNQSWPSVVTYDADLNGTSQQVPVVALDAALDPRPEVLGWATLTHRDEAFGGVMPNSASLEFDEALHVVDTPADVQALHDLIDPLDDLYTQGFEPSDLAAAARQIGWRRLHEYKESAHEERRRLQEGGVHGVLGGADDRYEIPCDRTAGYPYTTLVDLHSRSHEGTLANLFGLPGHHCSGTLIGSEWVLTAAHCLFDFDEQRWMIPTAVKPSACDGEGDVSRSADRPSFSIAAYHVTAMWRTCGSRCGWKHDVGLLRLKPNADGRHAGDLRGFLSMATHGPTPFEGAVYGYPAAVRGAPQQHALWGMRGPLVPVEDVSEVGRFGAGADTFVTRGIDVSGGTSGSGTLLEEGGKYHVVGVAVAGGLYPDFPYNVVAKLTNTMLGAVRMIAAPANATAAFLTATTPDLASVDSSAARAALSAAQPSHLAQTSTQADSVCSYGPGLYVKTSADEPLCFDAAVCDRFLDDGICDDGGKGSDYSACPYGGDCADCEPRTSSATAAPAPHNLPAEFQYSSSAAGRLVVAANTYTHAIVCGLWNYHNWGMLEAGAATALPPLVERVEAGARLFLEVHDSANVVNAESAQLQRPLLPALVARAESGAHVEVSLYNSANVEVTSGLMLEGRGALLDRLVVADDEGVELAIRIDNSANVKCTDELCTLSFSNGTALVHTLATVGGGLMTGESRAKSTIKIDVEDSGNIETTSSSSPSNGRTGLLTMYDAALFAPLAVVTSANTTVDVTTTHIATVDAPKTKMVLVKSHLTKGHVEMRLMPDGGVPYAQAASPPTAPRSCPTLDATVRSTRDGTVVAHSASLDDSSLIEEFVNLDVVDDTCPTIIVSVTASQSADLEVSEGLHLYESELIDEAFDVSVYSASGLHGDRNATLRATIVLDASANVQAATEVRINGSELIDETFDLSLPMPWRHGPKCKVVEAYKKDEEAEALCETIISESTCTRNRLCAWHQAPICEAHPSAVGRSHSTRPPPHSPRPRPRPGPGPHGGPLRAPPPPPPPSAPPSSSSPSASQMGATTEEFCESITTEAMCTPSLTSNLCQLVPPNKCETQSCCPRLQMDVEVRVTNSANVETSGALIIFDGELIDETFDVSGCAGESSHVNLTATLRDVAKVQAKRLQIEDGELVDEIMDISVMDVTADELGAYVTAWNAASSYNLSVTMSHVALVDVEEDVDIYEGELVDEVFDLSGNLATSTWQLKGDLRHVANVAAADLKIVQGELMDETMDVSFAFSGSADVLLSDAVNVNASQSVYIEGELLDEFFDVTAFEGARINLTVSDTATVAAHSLFIADGELMDELIDVEERTHASTIWATVTSSCNVVASNVTIRGTLFDPKFDNDVLDSSAVYLQKTDVGNVHADYLRVVQFPTPPAEVPCSEVDARDANGATCGARLAYLRAQQAALSEDDARAQLATEFPTVCVPCGEEPPVKPLIVTLGNFSRPAPNSLCTVTTVPNIQQFLPQWRSGNPPGSGTYTPSPSGDVQCVLAAADSGSPEHEVVGEGVLSAYEIWPKPIVSINDQVVASRLVLALQNTLNVVAAHVSVEEAPPEMICYDDPECGTFGSWTNDGVCSDGGPGAEHAQCEYGGDCTDCGPRYKK